eukprot:567070-Rhodomonas_salina.4
MTPWHWHTTHTQDRDSGWQAEHEPPRLAPTARLGRSGCRGPLSKFQNSLQPRYKEGGDVPLSHFPRYPRDISLHFPAATALAIKPNCAAKFGWKHT